MAFWATPLALKVTLASDTSAEKETRRVVLPNGASTKFEELRSILGERFGKRVAPRLTYVDGDRDTIVVSTDAELREALALGVNVFGAVANPPLVDRRHALGGVSDEWEDLGTSPNTGLLGVPTAEARSSAAGGGDVPWTNQLRFWVDGEEVTLDNPSPSAKLLSWLREVKGKTSPHTGCGEGGCGICTVAMARKNPETGKLETVPINSCLRRLCAVDGCHIVTSSGIGCQRDGFHEVQSAIAEGNGSQCGFCTPGWVMSMYALLEKNRSPSREEVEQHFDGNLCRCTGYRPILTAFGAFAEGGKRCGKHRSIRHPAALLSHVARPLRYVDEESGDEWYRPTSLDEYRAVLSQASGKTVKPVCANTTDGIVKYFGGDGANNSGCAFVDITLLPELRGIRVSVDGLTIGAATPLEKVIEALEGASSGERSFRTLADHLKRVASVPIRSVGSWAGNVMFTREHPQFQSDVVLLLAAAGARFDVMLGNDTKVSTLSLDQLLATAGQPALLLSMTVPRCPSGAIFESFRTSQRHVFAYAIVNFAACLCINAGNRTVTDARIVLSGATNTLLVSSNTVAAIRGRKLDDATFRLALSALQKDLAANPSRDLHYSATYRSKLAASFLYKTFLAASVSLPATLRSALEPFVPAAARPISRGKENYGTDSGESPVGEFVPKRSSFIQASGEALYPSDFGGKDALFGQLVLSTTANATLVALDASAAFLPGVHGFISASDIPGLNAVNGSLGGDNLKEKLFFEVNDHIPCIGVALGLIVADTWHQAHQAASKVVQLYRSAGAVVTSIHEALQLGAIEKSGVGVPKPHGRRGVRQEFAGGVQTLAATRSAHKDQLTAKGVFTTGGQSHFYMETQACCAVPHDGDEFEVIASDQDSNTTQANVALILGLPQHKVNIKVPRVGGGFGGKLLRQCVNAGAAVVAAKKFRRTVRIQNNRLDDMRSVAGREPLQFDYTATFDKQGNFGTLDMQMTIDPGWFLGDVEGDLTMAVQWADNCYRFNQGFKVTPQAAITNTPHRTSQRAPGNVQSILATEVLVEHVAKTVGRPVEEVQELNFYKEGDVTPFGDHIGKDGFNWTIPTLWSQIQKDAQYADRKKAVDAYNSKNRWTKKGIALSPVKYFITLDDHWSGALVCIYGDGSVLVSTGGAELGQGLDTKVALCVANALDAPLERVQVGPRETSKVPDNCATGGSSTSESSAQAAILACEKLVELLKPYRTGQTTWEAAVAAAVADKVVLMETGWFKYQADSNAHPYATYGTSITEVLIDVLTGEVRVERVDLLMDLGNQLDAAVDIGQLQGGFVMSLGYLLTEELKVDSQGAQLNAGTWEYKIPSAYDIPIEFNVSLLKDSPNPRGIKGSKASAEPTMCLIPSAYFAVKNALYAARKENGLGDDWFMLDVPLSPENICRAAGAPASEMVVPEPSQ